MLQIVAITEKDISYIQQQVPADLRDHIHFARYPSIAEACDALTNADVILTLHELLDEHLARATRLRWVQTLSAGVDRVPLASLKERGILLTCMRGIHAIQMSEMALNFMLQWVRQSHVFLKQQQEMRWNPNVQTSELYEKTLGVIGAGAIGEQIARKAKAFDMKTIGYNQSGRELDSFDEIVTGRDGLERLLSISDFLVVLLPSTLQTRHFLQKEHFQLMKREAFLINMARGTIINEKDLVDALESGEIAGAALDVFETEPLSADSPLWKMENVWITPHVAGASPYYIQRASTLFFENVRRFVNDLPLANVVNMSKGY
ncbi:D-2-hydroxyacid dehydrogenase [Brevibacillus invocatus]|uniref:D-2-hydroxyacid dehydrogenase n=1 Tax=Brevibacillus invocatus TaxID=173959 RepID=UPI00203E075A|nr:D-2-hydroxyacid dehydrogenase [Brevibacillus invocatus]MCM3082046.1 D-2-hydroxyacid dehydrogenase [Brevibacillus invocatus]MCM3432457.1 D-2-hydroxyacid dehydrogenase [Brevibacillus invocatus]